MKITQGLSLGVDLVTPVRNGYLETLWILIGRDEKLGRGGTGRVVAEFELELAAPKVEVHAQRFAGCGARVGPDHCLERPPSRVDIIRVAALVGAVNGQIL